LLALLRLDGNDVGRRRASVGLLEAGGNLKVIGAAYQIDPVNVVAAGYSHPERITVQSHASAQGLGASSRQRYGPWTGAGESNQDLINTHRQDRDVRTHVGPYNKLPRSEGAQPKINELVAISDAGSTVCGVNDAWGECGNRRSFDVESGTVHGDENVGVLE